MLKFLQALVGRRRRRSLLLLSLKTFLFKVAWSGQTLKLFLQLHSM